MPKDMSHALVIERHDRIIDIRDVTFVNSSPIYQICSAFTALAAPIGFYHFTGCLEAVEPVPTIRGRTFDL